jgi:hypothetical protein
MKGSRQINSLVLPANLQSVTKAFQHGNPVQALSQTRMVRARVTSSNDSQIAFIHLPSNLRWKAALSVTAAVRSNAQPPRRGRYTALRMAGRDNLESC